MMDETEIATATTTADEHVIVVCDEVLLEEADNLIDECEVNMVQDIMEGEKGEDQLQFIVDNDGKISIIQNGKLKSQSLQQLKVGKCGFQYVLGSILVQKQVTKTGMVPIDSA